MQEEHGFLEARAECNEPKCITPKTPMLML